MMNPNVMDITGPISGDTSIAAVILGALFSTRPRAARELKDHKQTVLFKRINGCIMQRKYTTQKKWIKEQWKQKDIF